MFGRAIDVLVADLRSVVTDEALLSVAELGEALTMAFSPELPEYLAARTWLRRRLAEYLACTPEDIRFESDDTDKPVIVSPETDLTFDFGCADNVAVLAVGFRRKIGVAVAAVEGTRPDPGTVSLTLTPDERDRYGRALNPERAYRQFYARKTALCRAGGYDEPLQTIDTTGLSPVNRDGYDITDLSLGDGLVASVAAPEQTTVDLTIDDAFLAPDRRSVGQRVDALVGIPA